MKKIGLFFGSFNPVHIGHLILANSIVENTDLDKVWFVVTPHNPFKNKSTLLEDHHRLEMVNLAIEKYSKFESSNVEFSLPKPSYTIDTLVALQETHPNKKFVLLMGEDNWIHFPKWKNYEEILRRYEVYVYPRSHEYTTIPLEHPKMSKIAAPKIEISSTLIREYIKNKKNIRPLLPPEVYKYIDGSNLYK